MTDAFAAIAPLDQAAASLVAQWTTPALLDAMRLLSAAHAPRGMAVLLAGACAGLLALRDRAGAAWLLLSFYSGAALNHLLKHAVQRPRPGQSGLEMTDFAFPSGHAAQATLLYGALLALLWRRTASRRARVATTLAAALLVAAVGASRLVLQAHWLSDVLGGVLVGAAWLMLALAARRAMGR